MMSVVRGLVVPSLSFFVFVCVCVCVTSDQ